jgi:AcrR family transcriptional regulator
MAWRSSAESASSAERADAPTPTRALGLWPWSPQGGALPTASSSGDDPTLVGAEETRHRLLGIAADLFRRKGFARATTRELAGLLGLKKASLYHYVSSKQELLYEICIESLNTISEQVRRAIDQGPQPGRMLAVIRAHVETACRDQAMHAVMLIELRALAPERYTEVVEARSAYERQLRAVLEDEQEGGRLRGDVDCRYLTLMLLNLLNWTIFWYDPAGALSPRELADMLARQFIEGAGPTVVANNAV